MIHAKSESDITSLSLLPSAPTSPKRPAYYIQSPSRDSHEDADIASSATALTRATPAYNTSPMESPSHGSSYAMSHERQSNPRSSSASRVSGNWRWTRMTRKRSGEGWHECSVTEEEGVYDDWYEDERDGRISPILIAAMGFGVIFTAFYLVIWGASMPYRPQISMKSLRVHSFYLGEGSDRTGVPTKLLTVNCTATVSIHNPATFFGIYVRSNRVDLMYLQMTVATGELKKYYLPRTSFQTLSVNLDGRSVPLYGAGATLDDSREIPMKLNMEIQSQENLVGKLVKTEHQRHISCSLVVNCTVTGDIKFHPDSCTYN